MDDVENDEAAQPAPVSRKLRLRRETVRNLTEDILSSQGHSLWTCDDTRAVPGEPETTYVEIDARVEIHLDVRERPGQ